MLFMPIVSVFSASAFILLTRKLSNTLLITTNNSATNKTSTSNDTSTVEHSPFRIIIDGGSTGSRLHVFEFITKRSYQSSSGTFIDDIDCVRRGSWKVWPALSSFSRTTAEKEAGKLLNSTDVAKHLVPVFEEASIVIPKKYHATTSIKYAATAGMRLLELNEQQAIYDALFDGLINSNFSTGLKFPFQALRREDIATLDGDLEGLYGALAANYLHGSIDASLNLNSLGNNSSTSDEGPIGALDMGGSSTQLVFLPTSKTECKDEEEWYSCENKDAQRLESSDFFSYSYLSYGVDTFRQRLWSILILDHQIQGAKSSDDECMAKRVGNPCGFPDHQVQYEGYTLVGTGNASECIWQVQRLIPSLNEHHMNNTCLNMEDRANIVGGVEHPKLRGKFFAFSLYFFALDSLRVLSTNNIEAHEKLNRSWPTPSINELFDALPGLCSRNWKDDLEKIQHDAHEFTRASVLPHRCIEATYIVTLLRDGYGFHPTSRDITFTFLVQNSEVEWALGMALSLNSKQENKVKKKSTLIDGVLDVRIDYKRILSEYLFGTI